jgi:pimeloyl-ACP methyl ester carboxylesterase
MGSFVAQQLTLLYPERVDRLILYDATCGGKESVPQSPQVVKILSDFVNNRSQDVSKLLSVTFPVDWVKSHPNVFLPKSNELFLLIL